MTCRKTGQLTHRLLSYRLVRSLRMLGLECSSLLNEGYATSTLRLLRGDLIGEKHYIYGTASTNPMVARLAG